MTVNGRLRWLACVTLLHVGCGTTPASSGKPDVGRDDAAISDAGATPSFDAPAGDAPIGGTDASTGGADAPTSGQDAPSGSSDAGSDAAAVGPDGPSVAADGTDAISAPALPSPQPAGYPAGSAPRLEQKSFVGAISKQTIGFNVYLPPGYDTGTLRYPTIYDLHGLTGNQFEDSQWVVPSLEAAMKGKLIGPVIVVFPDGLTESYYADSADGKRPSETRIIRDLIPHVDATYRTIADRQLRVVTGFSMGGYGVMELSTKFPDVFRAGVAYDAALDTWQTLVGRRASIAQTTFGNDESYFNKYSPWANATNNAVVLRATSALRLVPGVTYRDFDAAFRDHLLGLTIPLDYVETTCPHDYGCVLAAQGAQSWTFIQSAMSRR